jgi:hypothetical protein
MYHIEEKTKLPATEKILSEKIAKSNNTIELKEEQGNAFLYLMERWGSQLLRLAEPFFKDHIRGESELVIALSGRDW